MPKSPIFPYNIEFVDAPKEPEPHNLIAGDTLAWSRSFEAYPATAGWVLAYVLNSPTGRIVVNSADITATGDQFNIAVPSAETKLWAPGAYQWTAVVALGRVVIAIDLLDATAPQDTRSNAEKALDNIHLMLAGRGGDGVQEYTINGRMLRRYSITELLQLRSVYTSIVKIERINRGEYMLPTTVAVHFRGE